MICPACRHPNAPGRSFCTECGGFLEWEDEEQEASAASVEPPPPARPESPPPTTETTRPTSSPDTQAANNTATPRRPTRQDDQPEPVSNRHHDDEPPLPEPPRSEEPSLPDRPCPRCRADNAPGRRLCHRCGAVLDIATASAPVLVLPWWRRIFRRSEHLMRAGYRPQRRAWRRPRVALPVVVLALAAAAWFARAELAELFTFAQDRATEPAALRPSKESASTSAPGHPARAAFDGYTNHYWAPAKAGSGSGQYIEAAFRKPVHVARILITSGCSTDEGDYLTQARPWHVAVRLYTADGHLRDQDLTLKDKTGEQSFRVSGTNVVRVRFTTTTSYGVTAGHRLAIAEIELFGQQ